MDAVIGTFAVIAFAYACERVRAWLERRRTIRRRIGIGRRA